MEKARLALACLVIMVLNACAQKKKDQGSPDGYDLLHPITYNMPESLLEISGITFNKGNPGIIYSEQDEDGILFLYDPVNKRVSQIKFGKKGDYEDIAVAGENVYILRSDGSVFSFRIQNGNATGLSEWKKLLPKGEYEGLFADEGDTPSLYVLCKECAEDKHGRTSVYKLRISTDGALSDIQKLEIEIPPAVSQKKFKLKPSALARHPSSGEWYILSSVNKVLLVTGNNFQVKKIYNLKSELFLQPEGIAFDKYNNLYISNEGDQTRPGTILKFEYKRKLNK